MALAFFTDVELQALAALLAYETACTNADLATYGSLQVNPDSTGTREIVRIELDRRIALKLESSVDAGGSEGVRRSESASSGAVVPVAHPDPAAGGGGLPIRRATPRTHPCFLGGRTCGDDNYDRCRDCPFGGLLR